VGGGEVLGQLRFWSPLIRESWEREREKIRKVLSSPPLPSLPSSRFASSIPLHEEGSSPPTPAKEMGKVNRLMHC